MLAAPLLAGNNLTQMNDDVKEILTIEASSQSIRTRSESRVSLSMRPLADGSKALAVFNLANDRAQMRGMRLHLKEAGYPNGAHAHDVWTGKDLGKIEDGDVMPILKRGAILLRLTK
jgi:alpha-galactosidase